MRDVGDDRRETQREDGVPPHERVQNPLVQPYAPWSRRDRVAREIARRGGAFTASHREDAGAVMPFQGRAVEARSIHEAVDVQHRHEPRSSSSAASLARVLRICCAVSTDDTSTFNPT